ncbi:MAG: alpha/beta hydrolase [Chloroherpetonaceae bacterium]|nr:alpha/beta hydrolase [Chloroherpetonaceae bacterium]
MSSLKESEFKFIQLGNYNHRYFEAGAGQKTLVLLHGFSSSIEAYERVIPLFASHYRVLALDWLGFGGSDKPSTIQYSLTLYASLLSEFLAKTTMPGEPLVAVGHSMGAKYLLANETIYPKQFEKLVLTDSDGFLSLPGFIGMASVWGVRHVLHKVVSSRKFVRKTMQSVYHNPTHITPAHFERNWEMVRKKENYEAMMALNRSFKKLDLKRSGVRAKLGEVKKPVLIIWGRNDRFIPPKYAELIHREIKGSTLHFIEECGHVPMVEKPEEYFETVVQFVEKK